MANKYLNYDGVAYLWEKIKAALSGKVDTVAGKGLSTNDYTTNEKNKLSNIAAGAQVNVLEGVQVNGSSITPTNKIANIPVPTKTSDITNDSGYITAEDVPEGAIPSSTTPKMNGTAAVGTETAFSRGDHVHPSDTSKVDKVTGKGLSANDFTDTLLTKLNGIEAGAEVNVQADWNVSSSSSDAFIKNKPSIPSKTSDLTNDNDFVEDASYVHTDNNYTTTEKNKLSGIATGAEVNQNAFSKVKVGSTNVEADSKTDTLEIAAGSNVTITPDATNDKITIAATDTTYSDVTAGGASGLMSGADKTKLDGIAAGAQVNSITGVKGDAESSYRTGNVNITAANVGAIATSARGAANGVCPLDANSKVDSSYLPSYVDDIIEAYPRSGATELSSSWLSLTSGGSALTPETGKIYILMAASTSYPANAQFRWSGSTYVKLSDGDMVAITTAEIDTITAA